MSQCITCGSEDPDPDHRVPCPNCGDMRRIFNRHIVEQNIPVTDHISVTATFHNIPKFYRKHPKSAVLHLVYAMGALFAHHFITPLDPVLGFTVAGIIAVMVFVRSPYTKNHLYP